MIEIARLNTTARFKYLWLKGVNDVNLGYHCARSLIGIYSKMVNPYAELNNCPLDIPPHKAYYLCGVSEPYVYLDNFHLAFKEQAGSVLEVSENGVSVKLLNAVKIPFTERDVDFTHPKSGDVNYFTCRNWQFAHKFAKENGNV